MMPAETRPVPNPDPVTAPFWAGCASHRLLFQECGSCGARWLPPSVVCPRCWSEAVGWVAAEGAGTVMTFAVYRRVYHPAFRSLVPYVVAVVELAEGPRLVSNVVGISPERVCVGMPVRVEFERVGDIRLPVFRPGGGGD